MRNLKLIIIAVFLIVSFAFSAVFLYDRMFIDRTAPIISSDGQPLRVSVSASDKELCTGLIATDNRDGDITNRIIVQSVSQLTSGNTATVRYAVFDSSSNFCHYARMVEYTDYQRPHFSLSKPLVFGPGSTVTFTDRLTATDVIDGDISNRIRLAQSNLLLVEEGSYTAQVQVSNSSGDIAVANLTVLIQNTTLRHPVLELKEYITYVDLGTECTAEDFRSFLTNALSYTGGAPINFDDISVSGEIDTSRQGTNNINFSYTNENGLSSTVVLAVIVE